MATISPAGFIPESQGVSIPAFNAKNATITGVISSASTQIMLPANSSRKGFTIWNSSTQVAYVAYAATSTIGLGGYTLQLQPGSFYETETILYKGVISIIWASANGYANVTELT